MPLPTFPLGASKPPHPSEFINMGDNTLFFYTSGRWLWDESAQLRIRYQPFNVEELKQAVARAVNAELCVSIKLPECSYSKTFLLRMDNDILNFATASEVATLDFIRNELSVPVPRVFAGRDELGKSWPTMDIADKVNIVSQVARIQAKIATIYFGHYAVLFYKEDIEGGIHVPGIPAQFCIGPNCDIRFYDDREPPDCHIALLDKYRKLMPHSIPSEQGQNRSENQIVSIIDWQDSSLPVFYGRRIPKFLKINGPLLFDLPPAAGLARKGKRRDFAEIPAYTAQRHYISKFRKLDDDVFSALSFPQASTRQQLLNFAGYTRDDDGLYLFREMMLRACREWEELTDQPQISHPVTFDILGIPIDRWVHHEDFEEKMTIMRNLVDSIIEAADDKDGVKDAIETVGVVNL
ncbi:hypothetical protein BJX65DRAFT_295552 [Aspergillus insuetus]